MHVEEVKQNLQKTKTSEFKQGYDVETTSPGRGYEEEHKKPHNFFSKMGSKTRQDSRRLIGDATELYAVVTHEP